MIRPVMKFIFGRMLRLAGAMRCQTVERIALPYLGSA